MFAIKTAYNNINGDDTLTTSSKILLSLMFIFQRENLCCTRYMHLHREQRSSITCTYACE